MKCIFILVLTINIPKLARLDHPLLKRGLKLTLDLKLGFVKLYMNTLIIDYVNRVPNYNFKHDAVSIANILVVRLVVTHHAKLRSQAQVGL